MSIMNNLNKCVGRSHVCIAIQCGVLNEKLCEEDKWPLDPVVLPPGLDDASYMKRE